MAIPIFEDFLYPFLNLLKDKDLTTKEMREAIITHFNLNEEDCHLPTKGGSSYQLNDRIAWSVQYLRRAHFIDLPHRGIYHITERGIDYLDSHTDLRRKDLMAYKEFADFANNTLSEPVPSVPNTIPEGPSIIITPTEQLTSAYQSINDALADDILQKTLAISPEKFEHIVLDLLVKMGYGGAAPDSAKVTRYSKDDGIDGIISEDRLGLDIIYLQAKRYKTDIAIGKPQIQQFSGALDEKKATKGFFITTSSYSKDARKYVAGLNKKIVLIDGQAMAHYMIEYNVGVSTQRVYELKKIDTDYFEE